MEEKNNLLKKLENFYIEYDYNLFLGENIKFGVELEYEDVLLEKVSEMLDELYKLGKITKHFNDTKWINKKDATIRKEIDDKRYGGEINTPILIAERKSWQELELICNKLKELNANITEKTSSHIHINEEILGKNPKDWLKFIKLWIIYEEIIYRFLYGEYSRGRDNECYRPVRLKYLELFEKHNLNEIKDLNNFKEIIQLHKNSGLSFRNVSRPSKSDTKNTIEIRVANGTFNPAIIQNNLIFIVRLIEASLKVSETFLTYKLLQLKKEENLNEININEALELANLIFKNEYEKLSFLKIYIKSYIQTNEFKKIRNLCKES